MRKDLGRGRPAKSALLAALAAVMMALSLAPAALAGSVENSATTGLHTDASDATNLTVVGEGQNNNVVITNKSNDDDVSLTGVLTNNLGWIAIGVVVVAGVAVLVVKARKGAGDGDE